MNDKINAVFVDLGGTFRIVMDNKEYKDEAMKKIAELCGTDIEPHEFHDLLESRYDKYRDHALAIHREATEPELWTSWLAYDYPRERIIANAVELTYQYRRAKGERVVVEHGIETIKELHRRGYTLGIISDLIGTIEIDEWLDADGLREYFSAVQLSSVCCIRKPDVEIYRRALVEAGVTAGESLFVGDNLKRDILGAKDAGFGLTIAVNYEDEPLKYDEHSRPDGYIKKFDELLDILPERGHTDFSKLRRTTEVL